MSAKNTNALLIEGTRVKTVESAVDEDARKRNEIQRNEITFVLDGADPEGILDEALRSLVIKWQSRYRRNPDRYPPGKVEIRVADALGRTSADPMVRARNAYAAMSDDERKTFDEWAKTRGS